MTTTPLTTADRRVHEPICPPWCDGHAEPMYQVWEAVDGRPLRSHSGALPSVGDVGVELLTEEDTTHELSDPRVVVYLGTGDEQLTPLQAIELGEQLIDAANHAIRFRPE